MLFVVLSGFVAALIAPWLQRVGRGAAGWIIALIPLGLTVFLTDRLVTLAPGAAWQATYPWVPSLGLSLALYGDGLSLLFALLICGVGTIIIVYASGYLAGHPHLGRFYAYILMFMASMLGLVLVDNVLTLYVFWELTSLSSYLLIGFEHERGPARDAALQALIVTGAGGLALLAGMILLGHAGESWTLSALLAREEGVQSHPLYLPILMLSLAGICTKSAQMPFHFWLPSAMEAPTPVSAYLHSATMVKAGIYLLARLTPILGGTLAWQASATTIGAVTMLIGAWLAVLQTDMKRVLAYATVSALGMLTLLLGLGSVHAVQAALAYLLAHALYKGALFLVAGAVEHETGTRDVTGLGGLARSMPLTTLAAGLAALSMAGVPPLLGFIGKELAYETVLEAPFYRVLLSGAVAATGVLFVAVAGIVGVRPFLGQRRDTPQVPHRAPLRLWLGPFLLAAAGLGAGLWCEPVGSTLLAPAVSAVLRQPVTVELALWHGWTATLFLSLVSVLAGVGLYAGRHAVYRAAALGRQVAQWGPARGYERLLAALYRLAEVQTRLLQSGYLRYYLLMTLVSTVGLVGWTLVRQGEITGAELGGAIYVHEAWLAGLIVAASVVTIRSRSRLTAIAALGVVGYSVALLFVLLGAPDLAIAQFLIETLMVILFVLVLYHLPGYTLMSLPRARFRDAVVALTAGCLITALVLVTAQVQWYEPISEYFIRHSLSQAHGRNIVNVILVDFRGIDTLGEITVLAVAALGVYALLKLRPGAASETEDDS